MIKTKLEAIRLTNEDVIATSANVVCSHDGTKHFKVTGAKITIIFGDAFPSTVYNANSYSPDIKNYNMMASEIVDISKEDVAIGQWFYYGTDNKIHPCDEDEKHSLYQ